MQAVELIKSRLESLNLPICYRLFTPTKGNPLPAAPYIGYYFDHGSGRGADNNNLITEETVTIELYTRSKDYEREAAIEELIKKWEWEKDENYIQSEKLLAVSWDLTIITKKSIRRKTHE